MCMLRHIFILHETHVVIIEFRRLRTQVMVDVARFLNQVSAPASKIHPLAFFLWDGTHQDVVNLPNMDKASMVKAKS